MNKREMKKALKSMIPNMEVVGGLYGEDSYKEVYLGSCFDLDPCGRYHHIISPNGVKKSCINYWERLYKAADELNGWIQPGEADSTDIYFCMGYEKEEEGTDE